MRGDPRHYGPDAINDRPYLPGWKHPPRKHQTMTTENDYTSFVTPTDGGDLAQLQTLAEQLVEAQADVAAAEKALEAANDRVKDLAEKQIPETMERNGLKDFTTATGLKITVAEKTHASINKERAGEAYAWLTEHGHSGLIDRIMSVKLGRGEDERAKEIHALLDGKFPLEDKLNVHAQTLSAFVREQLRQGNEVPDDLFNIHRQVAAKVDLPKIKAARR